MLINVETEQPSREPKQLHRGVMKANVFRGPGEYGLEEKPIPTAGPGEAVVQVRPLRRPAERISISFVANIRGRPGSRLATKLSDEDVLLLSDIASTGFPPQRVAAYAWRYRR